MQTEVREFTGQFVAQGDLNIFKIDAIPSEGLEQAKPNVAGKFVLAHSETGHNHVIDASRTEVLDKDEFVSYLNVKDTSDVVHLRDFDTHKTIRLPAGNYKVVRQREYTPEGYRRAAD